MTTTVKGRLASALGMRSLTAIGVSTLNDRVQLTGAVEDQATWQRVDALVRNIAGDNRVQNDLTIAGGTSQARKP
jgi:osmotically-inducible protein OsmY